LAQVRRSASGAKTPRTAALWFGSVAAVLVFVAIALLVHGGWTPLLRLDTCIANGLNRYVVAHRRQVHAWKVVSAVLSPTVLRLIALAAGIALWVRDGLRSAVFVIVAVEGTAVLSTLTKDLVNRTRPSVPVPVAHAGGGSYPSGHALTSCVAVGVVLVVLVPSLRAAAARGLVVVAMLIVLAVGFSRLILGVHYLSDVIGGWLLAIAWLLALTALLPRARGWRPQQTRRRPGPGRGSTPITEG